ncbi:Protein ANKUB1 [Apodemus speciosus]|uniref:Protein ANKUB1 n=1 Tax=Apodemus speciosus TaxID=105296 RepID=A0ABQ0EKZ5_APOSI
MMRIFIAFEGSFEAFDVEAHTSVGAIKQMVKKEDKPTLYVFNAVTQETMPIMENTAILDKKVSDLRTLVTLKCGFPVSIYCLRTPTGLEMYDCNTLKDYQIDIGTALHLDVWDGWKEFLMGCLLGQKPKVQRYLSKEGPVLKYQKRVALYIAAFHGHTELTEWALKQGVQPHEAVGVHPYRAWCHEALHTDVSNCPIHAAAEAGQLFILKAFVNCSVLCLVCKNAAGHSPLAIASKHQRKDCVLYLLSKMWSTVSFLKLSVPMRIYIKIKQWILRAQSRRCHESQLGRARVSGAKVGDTVMVDGFTKPKMTSKSWYKAEDKSWQSAQSKLPPCKQQLSRKPGDSLPTSERDTRKQQIVTFPSLGDAKSLSAVRSHQQENQEKIPAPARKEKHIKNPYLPQIPLPPVSRVDYAHPLFYCAPPRADGLLRSLFTSFSEHSGRTPRENAIYCLAVASCL